MSLSAKGAHFFRHVMRYREFDRARLYGLLPHAGEDIQTDLDEFERPLQNVFFYLRDLGFLGHSTLNDFKELVAVLSTNTPLRRMPRPPSIPPLTAVERQLSYLDTNMHEEKEE
jgi:hypothetical protein